MASVHINSFMNCPLLLCCVLFTIVNISPSIANPTTPPPPPKTISLPVKKILQFPNNQYITFIKQRTPLVSIKLALDTGLQVSWIKCNLGYVSSTCKPVPCDSPQCFLAMGYKEMQYCRDCYPGGTLNTPGCNNNTCLAAFDNKVGGTSGYGELSQDVASFESADGTAVYFPNLFFACQKKRMLNPMQGLASGVKGVGALGRTELSLPSQFAAAFGLDKKFAVCLSSKPRSHGVILFGKIDVLQPLAYTPIIIRPDTFGGGVFGDYFLGLKTIKVNDKVVPFDTRLLGFDYPSEGFGGTKVNPIFSYTAMDESILSALVDLFSKAMPKNVPRVANVSPFKACFNSTYIAETPVGPAVPTVDFVMENGAVWRMFGANTMEQVAKDVACLAFVDYPRYNAGASIAIGGRQMEDNLLEFDITNKMFRFSSSLLSKQTSCSKFASKYK